MNRSPGLSVRTKLTISYAGLLVFAGVMMLAALFAFRIMPEAAIVSLGRFVPDTMREPAPRAIAALDFLLLFGLVAGWILAGRMLAPLNRITDATRMAANGSLTHRIALEGNNDELRELADAFDDMLARIEAHVAEQRRFAANASHELRTPLAITQSILDVAEHDPNRDTDELIKRLYAVNSRAINLTEALLLLSRSDGRNFHREEVDMSLLAEEATETLLPFAEQRGITIALSGEIAPVVGSHALLLQMTTNLVHNAIVHNLPEGGTVRVETVVRAGNAALTIQNTGYALTASQISKLTEPFQRGIERIRTDHAGVGLGLAIVKSIALAHDGTLSLSPGSTGGLCVTVSLPLAPGAVVANDRRHRNPHEREPRSRSMRARAT